MERQPTAFQEQNDTDRVRKQKDEECRKIVDSETIIAELFNQRFVFINDLKAIYYNKCMLVLIIKNLAIRNWQQIVANVSEPANALITVLFHKNYLPKVGSIDSEAGKTRRQPLSGCQRPARPSKSNQVQFLDYTFLETYSISPFHQLPKPFLCLPHINRLL